MSALNPHAQDFVDVAAVLQDYFDGLYHSDTTRLRRVFHPRALYACASGGTALVLSMDEYFPIVDARPSPASRGDTRTDRILSIEFAGPVNALARIECAIGPKHFIDLLTLIRLDGRWQVIAKVFHYDIRIAGDSASSRAPRAQCDAVHSSVVTTTATTQRQRS